MSRSVRPYDYRRPKPAERIEITGNIVVHHPAKVSK